MSDYSISSVAKVEPDYSGVAASRVTQEQATPAAPRPVPEKPTTPSSSQAATPQAVSQMGDVALRFRVNPDTKQVTVYVVDRSSKQIIRTIPPDQMSKLNAGDLLELFA